MKNTESITTENAVMVDVAFEITHNISSSKGWGRYKASAPNGRLVVSSTGNEWVSAPHAGSVTEGTTITATLQTMTKARKSGRETIWTEDYRLVAANGERAELGFRDGLQVVVSNARLA